jgi:hypothetical protein
MMTIPSLVFALLISSLYGALYHLIRGGGLGRLLMFLIFGWAGFAAGHLVGIWRNWILIPLGELNLGMSTLGSLIFLLGGDWISRIQIGDAQTLSDNDKGV